MSYILNYVKNTAPIIITFLRQNVTLSVTVTNQLAQILCHASLIKMSEKEELVRLRLIAKRSPSVPHLQSRSLLPSNKFSSLFQLRRMVSWAAPNGGEGGIRTPGTLSGTTDFESVTFGHSATSPKSGVRKSSRRDLASTDYRSCRLAILLKVDTGMNKAYRATYNKIKLARKFT